jgi:hypothetical protein
LTGIISVLPEGRMKWHEGRKEAIKMNEMKRANEGGRKLIEARKEVR